MTKYLDKDMVEQSIGLTLSTPVLVVIWTWAQYSKIDPLSFRLPLSSVTVGTSACEQLSTQYIVKFKSASAVRTSQYILTLIQVMTPRLGTIAFSSELVH